MINNQISEESLQVTCYDFLLRFCPMVVSFAVPNGTYIGSGASRFAYIAKLKRMGLRPGVADMIIMYPGKNILFVEFKSAKGKMSKEQEDFASRCFELGFIYTMINSFEGFVDTLKLYKVPMKLGMYGTHKI